MLRSNACKRAVTNSLIRIGQVSAIAPGKMKCTSVEGHPILIANVEGSIYVTDDTCTHEEASLCAGSIKDGLVKCMMHNARFDVRSGKAIEDPAELPLKTYTVTIDGDDILIDW